MEYRIETSRNLHLERRCMNGFQKATEIVYVICSFKHSHKKRKDSLEGSLVQALLVAESKFLKMLVPRLPH